MPHLPEFIEPMLAKAGEPFDSEEHLFEIKWDGIRALAYIEDGGWRLHSRRGNDVTERYPELAPLAELPAGSVLDGELVVLDADGKPSFRSVLSREQARTPLRCSTLARTMPATYVVFDQLYSGFEPVMEAPLEARRELLSLSLDHRPSERIVVSDGVVGPGRDFFAQIVARDLEGVVAKRLNSRYFPGRRVDAWTKFRKSSSLLCVVLGFVPKEKDDFESLILAAELEGELCCVGRVGTGFNTAMRDKLNRLLRKQTRSAPLIPCDDKGCWVEAGIYCSVRFLEQSHEGVLREPVFERLIED